MSVTFSFNIYRFSDWRKLFQYRSEFSYTGEDIRQYNLNLPGATTATTKLTFSWPNAAYSTKAVYIETTQPVEFDIGGHKFPCDDFAALSGAHTGLTVSVPGRK